MFADDIVVFGGTADRQIEWKSCWMLLYLGVVKQVGDVSGACQMWSDVVWHCSGECKRFEERENGFFKENQQWQWRNIPTYLGVKITPDLNELKMMNARIGTEDGDDSR